MRNRKGYTRVPLPGLLGEDVEVLRSDQFPHLGVADAESDPGFYYVYHLPSRRLGGIVEGQDRALECVKLLGAVPGLEEEQPPQVALDTALAILRGWKPERAKKRKEPPVLPVDLEPVYNPGVTPSARVRTADRELASLLGQALAGGTITTVQLTEATTKAVNLGWREALMAEVDQTLANPDEVPEAPIRLLDGTPCSWEGFKESYRKLVVIGNDLQTQAIHLLDAAEDEVLDRALWRSLEDTWVALLTEGWMEWTACVAHFLASPPVRQQQVKDKLGYIGSRERGWGALGKKTFLRHPEIAEASKARRLVRYEREAKRGAT